MNLAVEHSRNPIDSAQAAQICGPVNRLWSAVCNAPPTGGPVMDAKLIMPKAIPILVPTLSRRGVMLATAVGIRHWNEADKAP